MLRHPTRQLLFKTKFRFASRKTKDKIQNTLNGWEYENKEDHCLKGVSISFELSDKTEVRGRLKRLLNKKNLSKNDWDQEKARLTETFKEILSNVPNSQYNSQEDLWYFSLEYHDKLVKALKQIGASVGQIPKSVANLFGIKMFLPQAKPEKQFLVKYDSSELSEVPKSLWEKLFPFQREGVEFAVKQGGRCLIGLVFTLNLFSFFF